MLFPELGEFIYFSYDTECYNAGFVVITLVVKDSPIGWKIMLEECCLLGCYAVWLL
jgi:hypothetical protein